MIKFIKFVELHVSNQDRALEFYTRILGFTIAQDAAGYHDDWRWIELEIPGAQTQIVFSKGNREAKDTPALVLVTDDVEDFCTQLKQQSVEFVQQPETAAWDPSQTFAMIRDSEGNLLMLTNK